MGKPAVKGFNKRVFINAAHAEGERQRLTAEQEKLAEDISTELKPYVIKIVERAFRIYCKRHGADNVLEEEEWKRFRRILVRML